MLVGLLHVFVLLVRNLYLLILGVEVFSVSPHHTQRETYIPGRMTVTEIATEHTQSPFPGGIYFTSHSANSIVF